MTINVLWSFEIFIDHLRQSVFLPHEFLSDCLIDLYTGKSKKKNSSKIILSRVGTQDLQVISLMLYQLSWVNIQLPAWIFMAFIKLCSIDSRNEQSPTCEVVHETNKAHFRNLLPNRFLPSSVGRALGSWSGGHGFQSHWEQFFFALPCMEICQIIWQEHVSWKSRISNLING